VAVVVVCCCCGCEKQEHLWVCGCVGVSGNNIGEEGAEALGPHLAKLVNMTVLDLAGRKCRWRVCVCGGVVCCCCGCEKQEHLWVCGGVGVSDNDIGEEGAKALGPHLAKLVNMTVLDLAGRRCRWRVCVCGGGCGLLLLWL